MADMDKIETFDFDYDIDIDYDYCKIDDNCCIYSFYACFFKFH